MKKLDYILQKMEDVICAVGLLGATVLMFVNVVLRYVFRAGLPWSEELIRYTMIWITFIGVALCARRDAHVAIDFFLSFVSKAVQRVWLVVVNIVAVFFCVMMTRFGLTLVLQVFETGQVSPALQVPFYIVYLCLPLGFGLGILRFTQNALKAIRGIETQGGPEPVAEPGSR